MHEPYLIGIAVAIVLITRALVVLAVPGDARDRLTIFLAGMRAALPLALALSVPAGIPYRAAIVDAVFATVIVTFVFFGVPLQTIVRRFYGAGDQSRIGGPESSS